MVLHKIPLSPSSIATSFITPFKECFEDVYATLFFLEKILDKYPNYNINQTSEGCLHIFNYTHLNLSISEKRLNHLILLINILDNSI